MNIAAESLLTPRPTKVVPFLAISIGLHVAFAFAMFVVSFIFAGPKINLNQTPIKASLVRMGKPRDEKLLPRIEEPVAPPAPEVKEVAPVVAAPPAPAAIPIPTKDVKEEVKPSKTAPAKDAKANSKSLFDAMKKVARAGKPEELEGQADGDPRGDSAKQEGERYFGVLSSTVKRYYDVSDSIPEAERASLKAEVVIKIDNDGTVLDYGISKPSGNSIFDDAVLAAVKKTGKLGPPPPNLRDSLKSQGIALSFKP